MVKYEKRIVCFIDILGFSRIISNTTSGDKIKAQDTLDNVYNALKLLRKYCEKIAQFQITTTQFSDSIVISFPWNKDSSHMMAILKSLKYIQILLLFRYDLLLRGGIVIGDIFHTDEILIGPAIIDAYTLESKCANSPRIVLDPKVSYQYNILKKKAVEMGYTELNNVIHKDLDDTSYIDYFNVDITEGVFDNEEEIREYFKKICNYIARNITSSDMSIRMKYLWMRNKIKNSELYKQPEYKAIYHCIVTNKKNKQSK